MSDLRWLYLAVAVVIVFSLLVPVEQPMTPDPAVRSFHDYVENLPEGSGILIAMDFDPQAKAELEPMAIAVLRHCLRKNHRVIGMTFWYAGNAFANKLFSDVAAEFPEKRVGHDYVYLGYQPGSMAQVITGLGENIAQTFPQDYDNRRTAGMPIFGEIQSLKQVSYIVDLAAGQTADPWILFGADKYSKPMGVGCTAVSGPDMYVRLDSKQINGLLAGMRGAADYETLIEKPDLATGGMFAQSVIHVLIVALVVVGNVRYFIRRRAEKREGGR
jgi:hypothetical protein